MKRSQINEILRENIDFARRLNFALPPFAFFEPEKWRTLGRDYDEIRQNMLGWDITDYGHGDFHRIGLCLFTLRNGKIGVKGSKTYAEKMLISEEDQLSPMHFHFHKMEDIINRGGGNMIAQLYASTPDEQLSPEPFQVMVDGQIRTLKAGTQLRLRPGESITMTPGLYHAFWAEKGTGKVLLGEVSMVNDDMTDNRFYEPQGRFPTIEEDEAPLHLLCSEYPSAEE